VKKRQSVSFCVYFLCLLCMGSACAPTVIDYKGHKVFNPAYLFYLETSWRDTWQEPDKVIKTLQLSPRDVVADIGAGGGYFTERFSKTVGPFGLVYATDVQDVMLENLKERARANGLHNVEVVQGEFDDPMLPENSCDLVFFSSVYKEIDNRLDYMRKVKRILKPGGRVAIIEYRPEEAAVGPPIEMRLSSEQVKQELAGSGFTLENEYDFLPREYFLVFVADEKACPK
jgi:ubiquinone/menaquinone biosynthesis C-methylase UbiE